MHILRLQKQKQCEFCGSNTGPPDFKLTKVDFSLALSHLS